MFLTLYGSTAAELREHYIRWWFVPVAAALLRREGFGSVTLAFAQHWDNMIDEEVQEAFFVSPSPTPGWPMEEVEWGLLCDAYGEIRGVPDDPFAMLRDDLVPAFAPFCKLDGHDEMSREEAFLPYAVARMNDGQLQVEIVGRLQRPDEEVSPFVIPVVPRVERARCGVAGEATTMVSAHEAIARNHDRAIELDSHSVEDVGGISDCRDDLTGAVKRRV